MDCLLQVFKRMVGGGVNTVDFHWAEGSIRKTVILKSVVLIVVGVLRPNELKFGTLTMSFNAQMEKRKIEMNESLLKKTNTGNSSEVRLSRSREAIDGNGECGSDERVLVDGEVADEFVDAVHLLLSAASAWLLQIRKTVSALS